MQTYLFFLSTWTIVSKVSSKIFYRKHLTYVSMLHTSSCIYLLTTNNNTLATLNAIAYFTSDFMQIVYTNYYNSQNTFIFTFHHIISVVALAVVSQDHPLYTIMLKTFLDIEWSNTALHLYYITSRITTSKEILALANGLEAVMYGYYRTRLIKYAYNELVYNTSSHIGESTLFIAMYSFGAFFTGALFCTTFNRVYNLLY
uniref:Uncharacterized protein n=1 Tax=Pyramimonas orientalis virus TaxID=455367 RepID=A0A7M3UPF3_POV01|nr:hypothetical protein HWQ62_00511 [Pyramimonas orientalis virus]